MLPGALRRGRAQAWPWLPEGRVKPLTKAVGGATCP